MLAGRKLQKQAGRGEIRVSMSFIVMPMPIENGCPG